MTRSPLEQVEELWRVFQRHGLEAMLELVPDDVEWIPLGAGGRVLRGSDELRRYFADRAGSGERDDPTIYEFEQIGEAVLVKGSLRRFHGRGFSDAQVAWVYEFEGGRLVRAIGYRTVHDAREALASRR